MENNKEKWITEVFDSLERSERAKPSAELFAKIESRIQDSQAKIISIPQWRIAAAAAVLVLSLNLFALYDYTQNRVLSSATTTMDNSVPSPLISDYNIYEE